MPNEDDPIKLMKDLGITKDFCLNAIALEWAKDE